MKLKRRDFIKILGVTTSATILSSCGVEKATEKAIPILIPPTDDYIPGMAYYYKSTCTECPANCGVEVKTREFNAIKVEGTEGHPINEGKLCIRGQSSLMRLYHPERIRQPLVKAENGEFKKISWKEAYSLLLEKLTAAESEKLKNIYLSSRKTGSINELVTDFCNQLNFERWPDFELFSYTNIRAANKVLFGKKEVPSYRIDQADFLLTIGADVLETFVSPVNYTRQLARARKNEKFQWFHVEPHSSIEGFSAHHRLVIKPGSEIYLLLYLVRRLISRPEFARRLPARLVAAIPDISVGKLIQATGLTSEELDVLTKKLLAAKKPLVIPGSISTTTEGGYEVALLSGIIQWMTGAIDTLVDFTHHENYSSVGSLKDIKKLATNLKKKKVGVLFISQADILSMVPTSLGLKDEFGKAAFRVCVTDLMTETAKNSDLILPVSHPYECWGDVESRKGVRGLIQPAIEPVFDTQSEGDMLLKILQARDEKAEKLTYQDWLFKRWKEKYGEAGVDAFLKKGFVEETVKPVKVSFKGNQAVRALINARFEVSGSEATFYVVPSLRSFDGRSRRLQLLQEIPDPITTVSYGDYVSISKETARKNKLKDGDHVKFEFPDGAVWLPVKIQFGVREGLFVAQLGMMSSLPLAYDKRTGEIRSYIKNIKYNKMNTSSKIPVLSGSMLLDGRDIIPIGTETKKEETHGYGKGHAGGKGKPQPTLYPPHEHKDYRWAMVIDLDKCTACSACVAACYIENNVAMVGVEEHLVGREMAWIRLEPFHNGEEKLNFLVMLCQQCDNAPCEPVCPVYAAYHGPEGLNVQVYNRCVGTRYCSNNCPYKARRFNWFDHPRPEPLDRLVNPEMSVRPRGVMEKCTFCVQRIRAAKDKAKDEGRKVQEGEITPACAQTCPTDAIVFGNMLDKNSRVYQLSKSERTFRVLEEIGTQPAIHYLRKQES